MQIFLIIFYRTTHLTKYCKNTKFQVIFIDLLIICSILPKKFLYNLIHKAISFQLRIKINTFAINFQSIKFSLIRQLFKKKLRSFLIYLGAWLSFNKLRFAPIFLLFEGIFFLYFCNHSLLYQFQGSIVTIFQL